MGRPGLLGLAGVLLAGAALAQPLSPERERSLTPKDAFKECDVCPDMVVIPAGAFTMGSPAGERGRDRHEGPQHIVTFKRPFAVGKFEVTVDQFAAFVNETGYDAGSRCDTIESGEWVTRTGRSWRNPGHPQSGSHPVSCLDWNAATAYAAWLAKRTGKAYRLLAEAEWEYAARARTTPGPAPRYIFGNEDAAICRHGNGADRSLARSKIPGAQGWNILPCDDGHAFTAPVGSFLPNGFGLHDMLGNVWEWVQDCWNASYRGAPVDGSAWTSGDCGSRVLRGGAWDDSQKWLRAADRYWSSVGDRGIFGLRVARTLAEEGR